MATAAAETRPSFKSSKGHILSIELSLSKISTPRNTTPLLPECTTPSRLVEVARHNGFEEYDE
jgi:hypothetical protein